MLDPPILQTRRLLQETLEEEKSTDDSLNELAMDSVNQAALDALQKNEEEEEEEDHSSSHRSRRNAA